MLLSGLMLTACAATKEYVALGPNAGGPTAGSTALEWVSVEYPVGVSNAKDVVFSKINSSVPELGAWFGLDPQGLALTAKIVGDTMYALYDKSGEGSGGGCCADTLRIYKRDGGGKFDSVNLTSAVEMALNSTDAHVSHTFDMTTLKDGTLAALFQVKYLEEAIGGDYADAIVGMKVPEGTIIPTASGASAFNMFKEAGTMSTAKKDSRFKIQYYKDSSSSGGGGEQFHGNGVQRFTSRSGIAYLAFTHRMDAEAVVFKDPFTYSSAEGGGKIVQRFGTPSLYNEYGVTATRYFGLNTSATYFDSGVHNVFYTRSSQSTSLRGTETISLFVNDQGGKSAAYEFAFHPLEEGSKADPGDDTVFNVGYVFAKLSFAAQAQGGARTIGDGVFLAMSGADNTGLEAADAHGNTHSIAYSGGTHPLYDPFIRVIAATSDFVLV
jgi:hypothetical protein